MISHHDLAPSLVIEFRLCGRLFVPADAGVGGKTRGLAAQAAKLDTKMSVRKRRAHEGCTAAAMGG